MKVSPSVVKAYEQMTALRGCEYITDYAMDWIGAGDNRRVQEWRGVFQQKHLRYAVMTGRLNVASIRRIVSDGCDPSNAFDFCISPRMVRTLVSLGGEPNTLSYIKNYISFVNDNNKVCLHADGKECFRRIRRIRSTFRERILLGGTFPKPVAAWFDVSSRYFEIDPPHTSFAVRYTQEIRARGGVYSYYKMLREFSRLTKFMPVKVYFNRHFESLSRRVCGMDHGIPIGISIVEQTRNPRVADLASWLMCLVNSENADITKEVLSFL